ncbi:MAG TPA: aminotransferase class V-fold PLP-dependent enzyme, partial [Candidatus Methylomirabilis sp.]
MMKVYLDHNATTPIDPRVLEAMMPYLQEEFGNASSLHQWGRRARAALEDSRAKIASLLGAEKDSIVFTGGG